ncbi:hypothetical protein L3Y34_009360 [Caenorhabditis briggsae]|uniref:F-box domain-containing protein n=1 Tax=Caenorhabditis briggsae TaxID=6238 RepID=A0AAE9D1H1_CAEBR|nr:hypothetical protein L3Y34_009360 [Caenorhabditis briggsae]
MYPWKAVVENLVHRTQDRNVHLNNSQKADMLKDVLETLFENQQFYVIVFNNCDNGPNFAYSDDQSQLVVSLKRGLCNIIVYHSREWAGASQNSRNQFIAQVDSCKSGVVPWWQDYRGFPNVLKNGHIQNAEFVTLIRDDQNAQFFEYFTRLPVELQCEIVKILDFQSRHCLRQCSKQALEIVDSSNIHIPIVKIQTSSILEVTICEGVGETSTISVAKDAGKNVSSENYNSIMGKIGNSEVSFENICESIFKSLTRKNVTVGKLIVEFQNYMPIILGFIKKYFKRTKIITNCQTTYANYEYSISLDSSHILDCSTLRPRNLGVLMFIVIPGHPYVPGRSFLLETIRTLYLTDTLSEFLLRITVRNYVRRVWIPNFVVTDLEIENILEKFQAKVVRNDEIQILRILHENPGKGLLMRISKCGVVLEKLSAEQLEDIDESEKCELKWMCRNCDKSEESWFYIMDMEKKIGKIKN